jgi:hypothetical protein
MVKINRELTVQAIKKGEDAVNDILNPDID